MMNPVPKNVILTLGLCLVSSPLLAQTAPGSSVVFSQRGNQLAGPQLQYDSDFHLLDYNGDGKLDLFMPNTAMMMFVVHLNEGTATQPKFGFAVEHPINITETVPQTTEHNQAMATCDLNGDGLWDMLFFDGQLRYAPNTGTARGANHWNLFVEEGPKPSLFFPGSAKMVAENARYATGPETMYWKRGIFGRQVLTMAAVDWDGDGLQDLLISRFKEQAPGVASAGGRERWGAWGRFAEQPKAKPVNDAPDFSGPLKQAPPRGLYFYKNTGTKTKPFFDAGQEITTPDGQSIAAPNPVAFDVDGDGALDLLSSETRYRANAFRVDWPTAPAVQYFRRPGKTETARLENPKPLTDAAGAPIGAGTAARLGDLDGNGTQDLVVLDAGLKGSARFYPNSARAGKAAFGAPQTLTGSNFLRFDFIPGARVVNWFGPQSRDLLVFGTVDQHCKFSWRRVGLYRNRATRPGQTSYEFVGWLNYNGDESLVPISEERSHYDAYGSSVTVSPFESGPRQLMASVGGRLYRFSNLAPDGLTFTRMTPVDLKANQNLRQGQQEIPVNFPEPVKYIRISNDRNGQGNFRDNYLHIVNFEALSGGRNVATWDNVESFKTANEGPVMWTRPRRPEKMFTPGNAPSDTETNFTSFGYANGAGTITLKSAAPLERIRILFSEYEENANRFYWPFTWQGKLYRQNVEKGEPWYQYKVEVSADGSKWAMVENTLRNEMNRSHPELVDWDKDGKMDLVLGVQVSGGIYPARKEYRLYRNTGTNEAPQFGAFQPLSDAKGPIVFNAAFTLTYTEQCGISVADLDADGKMDIVVEGTNAGPLMAYRNISTDPAAPPVFQPIKTIRENEAFFRSGDRHYFQVADADGDGVLDLLQSSWARFYLHRGLPTTAPARVDDLTVTEIGTGSASLRWTRPAGAESYDLRWSTAPVTEATWATATPVKSAYTAAANTVQTTAVTGLPANGPLYFAIQSTNAKKEASSLSAPVETTPGPAKTIIVRQGPADGPLYPAYDGTRQTVLDSTKPAETFQGTALTTHTKAEGQRSVVLLRFSNLPRLQGLQRASLDLTLGATEGMRSMISVSAFRDDWDPAQSTWNAPAPGRTWAPQELEAGGDFLSCATPTTGREPFQTLSWDITRAVREAQTKNRDFISLLVRLEYTGKYNNGTSWTFAGKDSPNPLWRPRLRLTSAP